MFFQKNIIPHFIGIILLILYLEYTQCSLQGDEVDRWAKGIGNDLWNLGSAITKFSEIREKYKYYNAQVEQKNPKELLDEIKENILRMMDRKMDAIRCIQQKAEEVSEFFEYNKSRTHFQYYSSKYSHSGDQVIKLPKSIKKNRDMYLELKLNNDTHFYNLPVNTSHSSVHVPTNVYDREHEVAFAIQWSEALDEVFDRNYKSDPALSWQYFGSSTGIMRHFPAKPWINTKKDLFDCRIRTWFIEAATCTKDVVILIDTSGSMDGMGKHIAALTAYSILDTFSNNDYVNILNYSETTNYTVPCFENMLVQATKENLGVFIEAIENLKPDGKTKLEQALGKAFDLLSTYRKKRKCNENENANCNQAIMIITDGISGNLSETIMKHNYLNNGSNIPVRIFTYLIGKEISNEAEVQWIACANRGYHTHVQSLEQVTASVLQYINVIARPLVLQSVEHPVSWTHAYIDLTYNDATDNTVNEPYRLLTSAAIPCFDMKINKMNDSRTAFLLGVAATDVPIDDFRKLTLPYKIGVNAYSFIVSNNGYVLMHPDLRPVFEGILKENYNSVDLTEVEQIDDGKHAREISEEMTDLRNALVNGLEGSKHDVKLKYHYNNMRRVVLESYDYYYAPLEDTPFSIGIAIPNRYGNYSLNVTDIIKKNRHTGQPLTNLFTGKWKIHPKWVYCRYHYLENHEFQTPEEELVHFLDKMFKKDFIWRRQYEASKSHNGSSAIEKEDLSEVECGRKTLGENDYYCDRKLVERLIFDAKTTQGPFEEKWSRSSKDREVALFLRYNVSLRFVATMSGLTRWDYVFEEDELNFKNNTKKEFGDFHARAIDETWYKSAVIQYQYDERSFVYSVPFEGDVGSGKDTLVTGSYAIFPSDAGLKAPGSVVGFQFSQYKLKAKVEEIATQLSNQCRSSRNDKCGRCNTTLDCYVVDSNGYILVSLKDNTHVGKFFGEVEGDILDTMLKHDIFKEVVLYDLQALCERKNNSGNSAATLLTPITRLTDTLNWAFMKFLVFMNVYNWWIPQFSFAQETVTEETTTEDVTVEEESITEEEQEMIDEEDEEEETTEEEVKETEERLYDACEKEIHLYLLEQNTLIDSIKGDFEELDSRWFYVKQIPNSNLIFVAANSTQPKRDYHFSVESTPMKIDTILPCHKKNLTNLPRRRLTGCFNEHPLEHEIKICGSSSSIFIYIPLVMSSLIGYLII